MPTGPAHWRVKVIDELVENTLTGYEDCRCMIGEDHDEAGATVGDYWSDKEGDEDSGEALSAYDAADIWMSSGGDEDYSFDYSDEELEDAADEGSFPRAGDDSGKRRFSFRGFFRR